VPLTISVFLNEGGGKGREKKGSGGSRNRETKRGEEGERSQTKRGGLRRRTFQAGRKGKSFASSVKRTRGRN